MVCKHGTEVVFQELKYLNSLHWKEKANSAVQLPHGLRRLILTQMVALIHQPGQEQNFYKLPNKLIRHVRLKLLLQIKSYLLFDNKMHSQLVINSKNQFMQNTSKASK